MSRTRAALFARCLVLALLAPSAHADWLEVSGDHFVIYAGPIAYSPHPGEHTAQARQVLKEVEARLESEPVAAGN